LEINRIINGDSLAVLKTLPSESVNCCVTSPPYWALRDYGVEGQLGLEPSFNEYIDKLCNIFDEVKRVLRKDGTLWVNLGDTYSTHGGSKNSKHSHNFRSASVSVENGIYQPKPKTMDFEKCLCQIPSRFAIEMTNRGWILRNEIIWHKPNCMPSSTADRFTVDFEKVFFFVKSKKYYFEQQFDDAVIQSENTIDFGEQQVFDIEDEVREIAIHRENKQDLVGNPTYTGFNERWKTHKNLQSDGQQPNGMHKRRAEMLDDIVYEKRNKRCVWSICPQPFSEAHFAVYPETLVEPMIKAGCPKGGTVLDVFGGSGTTGVVAKKQDKNYILIELNPEYCKMAQRRIDNTFYQFDLWGT
jgi:DNA modification methylase